MRAIVLLMLIAAACAAPQPAPEAPLPTRSDSTPPGEPIAHAPGRVPPPGPYLRGFDALQYHVAVSIPETGARITATTVADIIVLAPRRDTLRLDLTGLRVTRVDVTARGNAQQASFTQDDGRIFIPLPAAVRAGDTIRVAVAYAGTPDDGLIIRDNVHGQRGAFGDNWPDRARFWFPAIDHPSDKATASFAVRAPAGWQVVANGQRVDASGRPLHARGDIRADAEPPADGVWRWRITQPIPTYLMVIGAARFAVATIDACADGGVTPHRSDRCVPTGFWSFPQDSVTAARIFARAGDMIEYYSQLIAPFPYERLAHVQSATRFGGMENAGAIFYSERAIAQGTLGEGTVAHETAHQWFGDAVTPARWADLWLSEGFATYFGALFFEHADGTERFREMIRNSWNGYLRSNVTHLPIVDTLTTPGNDLLELLNANSYNKGGAVLHMLRGLLGDAAFFAGVRRYYQRHIHSTATTADLRRALEESSGRDLGWFFEQWLYQPGHPQLQMTHRWDPQRRELEVSIQQTGRAFRLPMEIAFDLPTGEVREHIELNAISFVRRFPLPAPPRNVTLDPDGWVLKTLTSADTD